MGRADTITVEVAHARPERQLILVVEIEAGATLERAIRASGMLEQFPDIDLASNKVGVFGKLGKLHDRDLPAADRRSEGSEETARGTGQGDEEGGRGPVGVGRMVRFFTAETQRKTKFIHRKGAKK
jgi:putative ubiquitin-RnfH superfamily antitoxin RatB of RatAB toxin-antitoxin module